MRDPKARMEELAQLDRELWAQKRAFAGVDEAGRGPLCGPVVAACVVMSPDALVFGVDDSKKCSESKRESLYEQILRVALFANVGEASVAEIDELNILQATKLAMCRAATGAPCGLFLVDGNQSVALPGEVRTLVGGDAKCYSIAAASILAKVSRDRAMRELDAVYPGYGLARHKGYGTAEHIEAIRAMGPSPIHRRSFLTRILRDANV